MNIKESETLKYKKIVEYRKSHNLPVYNAGLGG